MTGLIDFSLDAASNDVAAPPINFQEGQPANTVNNSARALMAALAAWHADTSGGLSATGGAANALSLSTNQVVTAASLARPFTLAFTVDAANTGPCTLNADGTGAKALQRPGGIALAPGDLQAGVPYRVLRAPGSDAYILIAPAIERPGRIAAFATESAIPPGWVACDGRAVSRAAYAALFAAIGTAHGTGNGSTTFNVPDLRGRTAFGVDALGGSAANRLTGAGGLAGTVGASGGTEAVSLSLGQLPSHDHGGATTAGGGHDHGGTTGAAGGHDHGGSTGLGGAHSHSGSTAAAGGHNHSGSTGAASPHTHGVTTATGKNGVAGSGSAISSLWFGADASVNSDSAGTHSHALFLDAVGDHSHGLTTDTAATHGHGIPAAADHAHAIPASGTHAHGIPAAGSGQAHANIPPALVVAFAIKA